MATTFVPVETDDQIDVLADLSSKIFKEYYPDIVSHDQTATSTSTFLTPDRLASRMHDDGYEYIFVEDDALDDKIIGIIGMKPDGEKTCSSKLYLSRDHRGQGYTSQVFDYLGGVCKDRGLDAIWLQVNKNSKKAIDVYKVKSIETVRQQTIPLQDGIEMDEFIMEMPAE